MSVIEKDAEADLSSSSRGEIASPDNGQGTPGQAAGEGKRGLGRPSKAEVAARGRGPYESHKKTRRPNLKHGLYMTLPNKAKVDGRSRFGKAISQLRHALIEAIAPDGNPSPQIEILIDRAVMLNIRACSAEVYMNSNPESPMAEKFSREYYVCVNALRRILETLGIERKEIPEEDLKSYIARTYGSGEEGKDE